MSIEKFNLQLAGRTLTLFFELDSEFYSDQVLAHMLPRGILPEPEVINALPHFLEPGDCAIDAGANIGFFTIIMSKLVGKNDGLIIAVEPDPRNRKKLFKNLDLNDCRNVVVYEWPLAAAAGPRKFHIQSENGSSTLYGGVDPNTGGELVKVIDTQAFTLTDVIGESKPKFLKMDIEGAELEAIQGCDYRIPFVISEINEDALQRAGGSIEKLRFQFEAIWGHRTHVLSETGTMPAILADRHVQPIKASKANANVLFAKEWDVVRAWPEVKL